jgi:AcrR family transcriptional regulator
MPPKLVSDQDLHDRLLGLFRAGGFSGVTLTDLQDTTGLKRSSLYHRFPGGKLDMAVAVVDEVIRRFESDVLAPAGDDAPLEQRVAAIGAGLTTFYDGGQLSCLIDTMSVGAAPAEISGRLTAAVSGWIEAFAGLAREAGASRDEAGIRAADAVAAIEGALVVARTTGDTGPFDRAIQSLPTRLIG